MYLEINLSSSCTEKTEYFHGSWQSFGLLQTRPTWANTKCFCWLVKNSQEKKEKKENLTLVLPFSLPCNKVKPLTVKANLGNSWFKHRSLTRLVSFLYCYSFPAALLFIILSDFHFLIFFCKESFGLFSNILQGQAPEFTSKLEWEG